MAKLPSADQIVRSVPRPADKQVVNDNYRPVDYTAIGEATARAGNRLMNVGVGLAQQDAADREKLRVETDRLDNLRVEEAVNKLREREQDITLGEKGYTQYKGAKAIERTTPIIDEYSKTFDSAALEVESTLHTPSQKEKFKQRSASVALGFKAGLLKHTAAEADQYKDDVYAGTIDTEQQGMTTRWFNPVEVDRAKLRIAEVIGDAYDDKPQEFKDGKMLEAYQKINKSVIDNAIAAGQLGYAETYMKKNVSTLSSDDLIGFNDKFRKIREDNTIAKVVDDVISQVPTMIQPSNSDRLVGLVVKSGVPDALIDPASTMSPRDKMIVGKDMMKSMLTTFGGDVSKALAGYFNGNPRIVADAEKLAAKQGGEWSQYLPDDIKAKINTVTAGYQSGENPMPEPTLLDIKKGIKLRMAGMPQDMVDKALTKAESQFNDIRTDRDQQGENVLVDIMARVDSGQITKYEDLTSEEKATLGTKRTSARSYIDGSIKRTQDITEMSEAATTIYYALYTDPVALKSKSIADIMALTPDLGRARVNSLLQTRAQYINRPDSEKAAVVDSDQFKALAIKFGYNPSSPKAKQELLLIEDRVKQAITDRQNELDKSLTREEKDVIIKRMMTEYPQVRVKREGRLKIFGGEYSTVPKRGYQVEYPENVVVPADIKQQIINARGGTATEQQIREDYAAWLAYQKGVR